jgi:hypothetical protein
LRASDAGIGAANRNESDRRTGGPCLLPPGFSPCGHRPISHILVAVRIARYIGRWWVKDFKHKRATGGRRGGCSQSVDPRTQQEPLLWLIRHSNRHAALTRAEEEDAECGRPSTGRSQRGQNLQSPWPRSRTTCRPCGRRGPRSRQRRRRGRPCPGWSRNHISFGSS